MHYSFFKAIVLRLCHSTGSISLNSISGLRFNFFLNFYNKRYFLLYRFFHTAANVDIFEWSMKLPYTFNHKLHSFYLVAFFVYHGTVVIQLNICYFLPGFIKVPSCVWVNILSQASFYDFLPYYVTNSIKLIIFGLLQLPFFLDVADINQGYFLHDDWRKSKSD